MNVLSDAFSAALASLNAHRLRSFLTTPQRVLFNGAASSTPYTLTATAQTVAYTSAQQVTDFGSNQATLYVKVYQLSEYVGRGQPLTTSITR